MDYKIRLNFVPDEGYKKWDFELITELDILLNWFAKW